MIKVVTSAGVLTASRLWSTAVTSPLPASFWDIFDPLGSLAKAALSAYQGIFKWLSDFLASPPQYSDSGILPVLYGGSLNAVNYLAYYVLILSIILGVAFLQGKRIMSGVLVWVVVGAFSPLFIRMVNAMWQAGNDLAKTLHFYTPSGSDYNPTIDNPLVGTLLFMNNCVLASQLMIIVVSYELMIIFLKFLLPLAYTLGGLSKRSKKLVEMLVAVGLVATLFGKAFAQLFLDFGLLMIDTFPFGKSMIGAGIYAGIGLALAILSQIVLVVACYKTVNAVVGNVTALIKGVTVTTIKNTMRVDIARLRQHHEAVTKPPQHRVGGGKQSFIGGQGTVKERARDLQRAAGRAGVDAAAAAITAEAGPAAGMVVRRTGSQFFSDPKEKK